MSMSPMGGPQSSMQVSQFSATGIPGVNGGYAYPPGSEMTTFLDGLNNEMAQAGQIADVSTLGLDPTGMNPTGMSGGSPMGGAQQQGGSISDVMMQAMGMLFSIIMQMLSQQPQAQTQN